MTVSRGVHAHHQCAAFHRRNFFVDAVFAHQHETHGGWYGLWPRCVVLAYRRPYSDHHSLGNLLALDFGAGPQLKETEILRCVGLAAVLLAASAV
jgi:hypothetical protein